jgi:hypothetical protein
VLCGEKIMSEEILVNTKDLQIGDILNGKKIIDVTILNGFVYIIFDDEKGFFFGENIKITIRRDVGNPET